jgi:Cdc25 family phosphatase
MSRYKTPYQVVAPSQIAKLIRDKRLDDFIIIDVRDEDVLFGRIPNSVHIPSRNYESMLPDLVKTYSTKKAVIFHCMHSEIRGPKCAAMFKEMLPARHPTKICLLAGGFECWASKYQDEPDLLDDFNINYWKPIFSNISPLKLMMYRSEDFED